LKKAGAGNFLAMDLGAGSGRAVLGRFGERHLRLEEIHRFENQPVEIEGTLYWDALSLLREIQQGIRIGSARVKGNLSGLGIDTWGVDFGLLDQKGHLIGNPVHYRDERTNGIMEKVFEIVPRKKIFQITGIQFLQFNTLFQLAALKFRGWPDLDRAEALLMMPDLFSYFLCGRKSSEFTIASTTQFYDLKQQTWAYDLLKRLGIPSHLLQKIIPAGSIIGELEKTILPGQKRKIPVIAPASHDTGSAVAAVPAGAEDKPGEWAYLSSGTWSLLGIEIKKPIVNELALRFNFTNEGGVAGTCRFLKNIAGLWLIQECRRIWSSEQKRELGFQELIREARASEPFQHFIDPDDPIFLRPADMPKAIAEFCRKTGQRIPRDRGSISRCIFESLALKYQLIRKQLERVSGQRIEKLYVVGGGARNELLNQFTANALGIPVLAGLSEATALGNLVVQAMAMKLIPDLEAGRNLIRKSFPLKAYEPRDQSRWQDASGRFGKMIGRANCSG